MKNARGHREIQPPFGASRHSSKTPRTRGTKYMNQLSSRTGDRPGIRPLLIQSGYSFPIRLGMMVVQNPTTIQ